MTFPTTRLRRFRATPALRSLVRETTLEPGDLLLTGTPEGVGPLAPGQLLELEIEGLMRLSVRVAKER